MPQRGYSVKCITTKSSLVLFTRIFLVLVILTCTIRVFATYDSAPITHGVKQSSNNGLSVVTDGVDSSGANSAFITVAYLSADGGTLTSSKAGTLTPYSDVVGSVVANRTYYTQGGTFGSSHTFTFTCTTACYPAIAHMEWKTAKASPSDQESSGTVASGTSLNVGAVTPSEDNELIVSGIAFSSANSMVTVNSSMTIADTALFATGQAFGVSLAYKVQTSAAAIDPAWSWSTAAGGTLKNATFKTGTAATSSNGGQMLLGIGGR